MQGSYFRSNQKRCFLVILIKIFLPCSLGAPILPGIPYHKTRFTRSWDTRCLPQAKQYICVEDKNLALLATTKSVRIELFPHLIWGKHNNVLMSECFFNENLKIGYPRIYFISTHPKVTVELFRVFLYRTLERISYQIIIQWWKFS